MKHLRPLPENTLRWLELNGLSARPATEHDNIERWEDCWIVNGQGQPFGARFENALIDADTKFPKVAP